MISIQNIFKNYETGDVVTPVLKNVTFSIKKGEFVAIMGPSGSGKSTLMHILGLLDRATEGKYKLDGVDTTKMDDNELARLRNKKIGFIFQAFNLLPRTTALENVEIPLAYGHIKNKKKIAQKILESVGLEHRLYHTSNQLSGGEKQRVAIARALANNPDIIFADEPTGNLDSKSGKQVMDILQKLNNAGRTVILVTHEDYTSRHAKRIIKLLDGEIVKDEAIKERIIAENEEELRK